MNTLEHQRNVINEIDKEMLKLFEKRMLSVKEIALYKKDNHLPIFDNAREQTIIKQNIEYLQNECYKNYYIDFFKYLMNISKKYQEQIMEENK